MEDDLITPSLRNLQRFPELCQEVEANNQIHIHRYRVSIPDKKVRSEVSADSYVDSVIALSLEKSTKPSLGS